MDYSRHFDIWRQHKRLLLPQGLFWQPRSWRFWSCVGDVVSYMLPPSSDKVYRYLQLHSCDQLWTFALKPNPCPIHMIWHPHLSLFPKTKEELTVIRVFVFGICTWVMCEKDYVLLNNYCSKFYKIHLGHRVINPPLYVLLCYCWQWLTLDIDKD